MFTVATGILLYAGGALAAPSSAEQVLVAWLEQHGTKHNLAIKTPAAGERGVYATKDVLKGGLLASIPLNMSVLIDGQLDPDDYGWLNMSASLAVEAADTGSFFKPYFEALPMLHSHLHTLHYVVFPPEYLPLVKSKHVESMITEAQNDLNDYWGRFGQELSQKGVTQHKLKAACVTMATRMLMFDRNGQSQVVLHPLLDMANHFSNCTNELNYGPCPDINDGDGLGRLGTVETDMSDLRDICLYWTAGSDVKNGQEACLRYEIRTPDQSFFEYGFILPDDPPVMSSMDGAEFAWGEQPLSKVGGKLGTMKKELKHLGQRINTLEGVAKQEAAMKAAPTDPGGVVLEGLKRLRQQRLSALRIEVERLKESIKAKEALKTSVTLLAHDKDEL